MSFARTLLLGLLLASLTRAAPPAGFVSLFNGRDLAGWDGAEGIWRVSDGVLIGETTPEKPMRVEFKDIELQQLAP